LEDHFHLANPAAELLGAVGQQRLSTQLQQEMTGEMAQTDVDATLSADFKIESLTVKGTRLLDGKAVQLETCFVAGQEVRCKGQSGGAKLRNNEHHEFFYSFPFPMLSVGLIQRAATEAGVPVPPKMDPQSEIHGGGPPMLRLLSLEEAHKEYKF
jgi:hypothetical protein